MSIRRRIFYISEIFLLMGLVGLIGVLLWQNVEDFKYQTNNLHLKKIEFINNALISKEKERLIDLLSENASPSNLAVVLDSISKTGFVKEAILYSADGNKIAQSEKAISNIDPKSLSLKPEIVPLYRNDKVYGFLEMSTIDFSSHKVLKESELNFKRLYALAIILFLLSGGLTLALCRYYYLLRFNRELKRSIAEYESSRSALIEVAEAVVEEMAKAVAEEVVVEKAVEKTVAKTTETKTIETLAIEKIITQEAKVEEKSAMENPTVENLTSSKAEAEAKTSAKTPAKTVKAKSSIKGKKGKKKK